MYYDGYGAVSEKQFSGTNRLLARPQGRQELDGGR